MIIGIPKEIMLEEKRVAAIPETVTKYIAKGHKVIVEYSAGEGIFISDADYQKAGAEIIKDTQELFHKAETLLKVKQPEFNEKVGKHEIEMMKKETVLITFLHPAAPNSRNNLEMLEKKGMTALTMDGIPRISRAQRMDALTSMSTVTGYRSVIIAASRLPKFIPMMGTAIGMVKPANFLVIGIGVVGLQAIAAAKRLGGVIKAMDIRQEAQKEAESLSAKIVGFDIPQDLAKADGGYAKALTKEWLEKEREALAPAISEADVIILSALVPGEVAPIIITKKMLSTMRPGSVIIDVSIDQGGNCEATVPGKEVVVNNVLVSGLQNIPGGMAVHSTWLYANNMFHYFENAFKDGVNLDMKDEIVISSLVTREGKILHKGALKALGRR
ncbi:MAG: NAD(P) transhydrogenase subunit alpha [Desulfobacterales bacterium]|nr:NAD(P) transhydrogenase subunit alpha [Desulfobacterales bacterium]MBF0396801.1 NAD(P) transhydrogenase subunit alpha [Desulfobacterales bacterium]